MFFPFSSTSVESFHLRSSACETLFIERRFQTMSLWMWKRGSFATSCIKSYIAVTHFMIPLKWCDLLICGVEQKIFIFSPSNYRDYHTDFSCSGYFFTSLLPYVSTSVSQNVSIKDNVKNYLVPSRMSIDF